MTKNYDSDENMTAIMEFFKLNVDYCIQYLDTIDPEFKQVVPLLFSITSLKRSHN